MKAIITKYLGPTTTRGSRVKAQDDDGNSLTVSYNSALSSADNHTRAAVMLHRKMQWPDCLLVRGWLGNRAVFVTDEQSEKICTSDPKHRLGLYQE